jgi:acyl-coenzyme A thioesterase PaaI-like protein
MTTVDQTTHFMRPAVNCDVLADARIVRMGRSMAFGQVMLTGAADRKPLAMVSSAYALI